MSLFKRGNTWWAYVWIDGVRHHKSIQRGWVIQNSINRKEHWYGN